MTDRQQLDIDSTENPMGTLRELREVQAAECEEVVVTTDYSTCGTDIYDLVGYQFNSSI